RRGGRGPGGWGVRLAEGGGQGMRSRRRPSRPTPRHCRPSLEALEDRAVPSLLTVTNLANSGPGSLRAAVTQANMTPAADTIVFAPGLHGTITLASEIAITPDLTIDGPGANQLTASRTHSVRVVSIEG